MTLLIVGTAGADPRGLAAAITAGGWTGRIAVADSAADRLPLAGICVAILALDSAMSADVEEEDWMTQLAAAAVPTALAACRVDVFPGWPQITARSRARLDPERRLPVFATAADAVTAASDQSGIPDLVRWCAAEHSAADVPAPVEDLSAPRIDGEVGEPGAMPSATHTSAVSVGDRTDRIAGLRAGVVAARSEATSALRSALAQIADQCPDACAAPGFDVWLPRALGEIEHRSRTLLLHRLGQVRAAAVCGLGETGGASPAADVGRTEPWGSPSPRAGSSGEAAMVMLVGASMGFGIGRMALAPALDWAGLGIAGTVMSILSGMLVALWVVGVRRATDERNRRHRWAAESIAARRSTVEQWIGSSVGAFEATVSREIWNRTRPPRVRTQ